VSHPDRLGKYQITEVLGEGAMGIVYKALDPDIKRVVALKTIRADLGGSSESRDSPAARFRNEAQAAGRLTHPGIVAVYEFGLDQKVAYIAMEYVEGRSLAHYMASKVRFTDEDIPGILVQVLDALDHAHEQGVWHRDIKPANIIMARNGKLKIADFGIARMEDTSLTQTNVMIGTPSYMAPEQFLGGMMDRRVDIYACGVLLYLMLTGRPPFTGSPEQLLYKVVHEPPALPSQLEDVLRPRFYDTIIATALAKNPDQRYPSAAAFKKAIESGVGAPFDTTIWERTLVGVPERLPRHDGTPSGMQRSTTGSRQMGSQASAAQSSWTNPPTNWDRTVLAEVESSLAKHLGPLAKVLVRRAAKECADLPTLYAKLAEQVTNPDARSAFLERAASATRFSTSPTGGSGSFGGGSSGGGSGTLQRPNAGASPTMSAAPQGPPLNDSQLDHVQKLLAQHVGPIAKLVVKKAASASRDRATFYANVLDAVSDPAARDKLRAELARLA
jgi:serine/threonine-protein kinase